MATLAAAEPALAQAGQGRITGTVTAAETSSPLAGAQIHIVGTRFGTITRDDGRYAVAVAPGTYTVRVTRIGFAPDSVTGVVVTAGAEATADFRLKASATVLSTVVSIGYGTQTVRDRTGAVDVVDSASFNTGRVISPEQLIQSKVAGVQVVDNNEPGAGISVRIRGASSINASSEPLYVVDGVPLTVGGGVSDGDLARPGRNPLNFLNPNDIESISVLKDASAAAIYGSRGTNGVIIITTKRGRQGGAHVDFSSTISQSTVTGGPDLLSAEQFRAAVAKWAPENVSKLGNANTDWRGAIQRTGIGKEQQASVSGGREDMNYRLALGYLDQGGVLEGSGIRRLTTSLTYADKLFNRLDVTANLKGARTDDRFTPGAVLGNATSFDPTQPIRTTGGTYFEWSDLRAPANPLAELSLISDRGLMYRSVGNLESKYHLPFIEGLSTTLNLGYDVTSARRTTFTPSTDRSQVTNHGNFYRTTPTQLGTLLDLYGNYVKKLDAYQSDIDLTAGYSYENSRGDYPAITVNGLTSDLLGSNGIPSSTLAPTPTLFVDETRLASFFGRANYTLRDRYLVTLSVRRDGSSKFGPSNQWGVFPAAAFAWRVSEEPFMQRFAPTLSDLKFRLSWGANGNQSFSNYLYTSSYTLGNSLAQAQFGNEWVTTIRPSAVDPNIKWEQTKATNVGLDYGIYRDRVTGTIDYYTKKTTDLIFTVPVAAGTNFSDFVTTNIGSLQNRGLELGINAQVITGGFHGLTWNASFNAATNANKLLSINSVGSGGDQILTGGIAGGVGNTVEVLRPGLPINTFLVYKHKMENGKPVYRDVNGDNAINEQDLYEDINGDGTVNFDDRRPYKNPAPKWILGHSSNLTLGNFDGSFTLRAYLGNYVYNNVASNLGNYSRIQGSNTPINLDASVLKNQFGDPQYWSDVYIEKASFLRMDNVTLGYTFHNLAAISGLRLFGTIQNAFTVTGYNGVDPTSGVNGIDNNIYPRSRTFVTGANLQF
ncbi:MAG TPA: SusC/RagA family TonB-linked outer membrane protein [Gemmatimonadaceae bacterium]|nr:SusC/RagA family TonB-linked outer membrane protein [Gemmatimonadaceae bacterium]